MEDKKNIQWPGWETVRLIGRGSYGAVYEIRRELYGNVEKAALKHIRIPQNSSDIKELYNDGYDEESITATFESHLKNIISEYSLMRKLNGSANVVNCDDVRVEEDRNEIGWDIYIKMELLTPMTDQLPKQIPEETVIKLGRDLCSALVLCRKHSIVHRDIKPQNIFVSDDGDYKLGDFGIAKTMEKTMGGTKTGTYKYMAPEVYNNQPYGHQADIYSLGLVLYWLLNKKRMPFMPLPPQKLTAGMDEQARNRRLSGEPLPAPADGSEELKRIVLKACAYDPAERYHTADEMLADLEALEGGKTAHASASKAPEPPQRIVHTTPSFEEEEEPTSYVGSAARPAPAFEEEGTVGAFGGVQDATVGAFHAQSTFGNVTPAPTQNKPAPAPVQSKPAPAPEPEEGTVGAFGGVQDATVGVFHAQAPIGNRAPAPAQSNSTPAPGQGRAEAAQNSQSQNSLAQNIPGNMQGRPDQRQNTPPVPNAPQNQPASGGKGKGKKTALIAGIAAAAVLCAALVVFLILNNGSRKTPSQGGNTPSDQVSATTQNPEDSEKEHSSQGGNTPSDQVSATTQNPEDSEKEHSYQEAVRLMNAGDYNAALERFKSLGDYKDSKAKAEEASRLIREAEDAAALEAQNRNDYQYAEQLLANGDKAAAAMAFGRLGDYSDARSRSFSLWRKMQQSIDPYERTEGIICAKSDSIGLRADGSVVYTGGIDIDSDALYSPIREWRDLTAISVGREHMLGLRPNGTVVSAGNPYNGECDVGGWTNIVAISAGDCYSAAVRSDGTAVATGSNNQGQCNVDWWTDTVAVSARRYHTVGLRSDGSAVSAGDNSYGQCDVYGWSNLIAVSAGMNYTVGLRSDGTVVSTGDNSYGQCNVSGWRDIVAICAGDNHTVGLRSDGTVVAVGRNDNGECNVSGWTDIVAIFAGNIHTLGLRSDGTVVAVGYNHYGECDVGGWNLR